MTLRDDIRAGFDRKQATLGEVGDARHRLMQDALAARDHASHRAQWAAGIAAVLIAAIVITTFALIRGVGRPHATPAASPTATAQNLGVSDSTPILVIRESSAYQKIDAITWDGKAVGKLPFDAGDSISNPAANLFASAGTIRDRTGAVVASGSFGAKFFSGTWADDEVHFCLMTPVDNPGAGGLPTTLKLFDARAGTARDVLKVGTLYNQTFMSVAACSVEFDRAVVVQSAGQGIGTAQYWVVELSTGKILWTHNFQESKALPVQIVSSRDGQTIAESQGLTSTLFGLDGAVIGHIAGSVQIFCWDGSLALVDPGTGGGPATIVRISDGSTVWSGPTGSGFYVYSYAAQPDGASLAVGLHNPANTDVKGFTPVDLYIVAPDGHVVAEMKDIYW
ncbi:MAG: hypothetical protein E6I39_08140 [Chloroflexi bacterium]|nr:MAG: hypothetical protein E6I39_08140 [Chloroflexota bacterium]